MIGEPGYVFGWLHIVLLHVLTYVESDILACLQTTPILNKYYILLWDNNLVREGQERFLQIYLMEFFCYRGALLIQSLFNHGPPKSSLAMER